MSKPTRGATRLAASKKKTKKRPELRPAVQQEVEVATEESVRAEETASVAVAAAPVLQFRPRSKDTAPSRAAGRPAVARATAFPTADYSYVYTDLRIIAVLVGSLLVALIVLSFLIH